MRILASSAVLITLAVAAPALADDTTRAADARAQQTQVLLAKARRTGDAATIADAKARADAANAVAWGRHHPAKQPGVTVASARQ